MANDYVDEQEYFQAEAVGAREYFIALILEFDIDVGKLPVWL